MTLPTVMVGLPYSSNSAMSCAARDSGAAVLLSAGSMWRKDRGGFTPIGDAWRHHHGRIALDCGGFTAMKLGGYRWTVAEYVEFVVTSRGEGTMPFPWVWWCAMDYCCEPEIAADRAEVESRIDQTVASLDETLEALDYWAEEGIDDVPDPMPTLQGRTPDDYLRCAKAMDAVFRKHGRAGLPKLVGLGSVCRRNVHGDDGLLAILDVLDEHLPKGVKLHLFGVKGALMRHLAPFLDRIESVDSMAWDFRANRDAKERGVPYDTTMRAEHLCRWYDRQVAALSSCATSNADAEDPSPAPPPPTPAPRPFPAKMTQLGLFDTRA